MVLSCPFRHVMIVIFLTRAHNNLLSTSAHNNLLSITSFGERVQNRINEHKNSEKQTSLYLK